MTSAPGAQNRCFDHIYWWYMCMDMSKKMQLCCTYSELAQGLVPVWIMFVTIWPRPHPLDYDTCSLNFADRSTLFDPADPSWCVAGTALILSSTQYTRGVRAQCIHITVHGREYGGFPLVEHEQQLQLSFQLLAYSTSDGPTSHSNLVVFQWQRTQCHANETSSHTAKKIVVKNFAVLHY